MKTFITLLTQSHNAETITELTVRLENLTDHARDWLNENQMIANPSKFHAIILKKDQADVSEISLSVTDHVLFTETSWYNNTLQAFVCTHIYRQSMQKGRKTN